jgi:hypothetical protein
VASRSPHAFRINHAAVVLGAWLRTVRKRRYGRDRTALAVILFVVSTYCLGRVSDFPAQIESA